MIKTRSIFSPPLPLFRIWNWFILLNSRTLPYYIHFSMTPFHRRVQTSLMDGAFAPGWQRLIIEECGQRYQCNCNSSAILQPVCSCLAQKYCISMSIRTQFHHARHSLCRCVSFWSVLNGRPDKKNISTRTAWNIYRQNCPNKMSRIFVAVKILVLLLSLEIFSNSKKWYFWAMVVLHCI